MELEVDFPNISIVCIGLEQGRLNFRLGGNLLFKGFPTKDLIILVVTVTGWGADPIYVNVMQVSSANIFVPGSTFCCIGAGAIDVH